MFSKTQWNTQTDIPFVCIPYVYWKILVYQNVTPEFWFCQAGSGLKKTHRKYSLFPFPLKRYPLIKFNNSIVCKENSTWEGGQIFTGNVSCFNLWNLINFCECRNDIHPWWIPLQTHFCELVHFCFNEQVKSICIEKNITINCFPFLISNVSATMLVCQNLFLVANQLIFGQLINVATFNNVFLNGTGPSQVLY